eukprot:TRINITY_DN4581_c0_g1_i1.p2 TRINITY_DN4581_c0_g1~~TRINITY_DN4581_c0_g1_i1.p2  ORF type:complete len:455 (+),score=184.64 TRINITY_DN4581_c0_g1_i1:81-1445(+)
MAQAAPRLPKPRCPIPVAAGLELRAAPSRGEQVIGCTTGAEQLTVIDHWCAQCKMTPTTQGTRQCAWKRIADCGRCWLLLAPSPGSAGTSGWCRMREPALSQQLLTVPDARKTEELRQALQQEDAAKEEIERVRARVAERELQLAQLRQTAEAELGKVSEARKAHAAAEAERRDLLSKQQGAVRSALAAKNATEAARQELNRWLQEKAAILAAVERAKGEARARQQEQDSAAQQAREEEERRKEALQAVRQRLERTEAEIGEATNKEASVWKALSAKRRTLAGLERDRDELDDQINGLESTISELEKQTEERRKLAVEAELRWDEHKKKATPAEIDHMWAKHRADDHHAAVDALTRYIHERKKDIKYLEGMGSEALRRVRDRKARFYQIQGEYKELKAQEEALKAEVAASRARVAGLREDLAKTGTPADQEAAASRGEPPCKVRRVEAAAVPAP